ncbi:MAG: site-specific integrase [Ardenticatenaceae bacterium]|nr:site-specific integrase [Ardenticatenaceae bacterium]
MDKLLRPPDEISLLDNGRTDNNQALQNSNASPLEIAGQIANRVAGQNIFQRYLSEKASNTVKRHARDLELFAEYLLDIGLELEHGADFQINPYAWRGVTWGIVEGFVQWQLGEGYAISSVNARLSTVKVYAQMAVKAEAIPREEGMLIQTVKGYSRANGQNVDEKRAKTRVDEVTYAYKPESRRRTIVVTRRSTKKHKATLIDEDTAVSLKTPRNESPQAHRDALLMCLLLDHGLRASEVALLQVSNLDLENGKIRFHRPKVKGTDHEWTTHELTRQSLTIASYYIQSLYPPTLPPGNPLIVATTRLLKSGEGGQLLSEGLNRVRLSERVAWLGRQLGLSKKLSAHDCRHTCATKMARLGYGVDELMAWFGWSSAQTAMRYVASADIKKRHKG